MFKKLKNDIKNVIEDDVKELAKDVFQTPIPLGKTALIVGGLLVLTAIIMHRSPTVVVVINR